MEARIPEIEKLKKLCAVFGTRIEIQRAGNGFGDSEFQRGRPALRARQKSFTNIFEGALLTKSEVQSSTRSRVSFLVPTFSSGVPRKRLFLRTPWKKVRQGNR